VHSLGSKKSENRFLRASTVLNVLFIETRMTSGSCDNCWLFAAFEITGTDGSLILVIFFEK
jgi:hypothetical protein